MLGEILDNIRRMRPRLLLMQALSFGLIVASALTIWKTLILVTGSESPIVVVLSGSMEPAFQRGDLLFLSLPADTPFQVGEIVVYKLDEREIPIVHRILKVHQRPDGEVELLTKGDNNTVDDRGLYTPGMQWLERHHIIGRTRGFLPYVGMVTIIMNDYPYFKFLLIGVLGIFVLANREN
ncbi:Signal peptidase complex catalytic subunit S11A [Balamuthia mandrillaris]